MAKGIKFSDGFVLAGTVCLMGAPIVLEKQLDHLLGQILFWGGLAMLLMFLGGKIFSNALLSPEASSNSVVNSGAFIGGDNSGIQQVFHGPVTIAESAKRPEYPDREFAPSTLTVERLLANFEDKTDLQAQALCKPFIGKWMRIAGRVTSVSEFHPGTFSVYIRPDTKPGNMPPSVHCLFKEDWETRLHALAKDDWITVIGVLHSASFWAMTLVNAEIED